MMLKKSNLTILNKLTIKYREPKKLWNDIRNILKETAYKKVPKVKRNKVSKWLYEEALKS